MKRMKALLGVVLCIALVLSLSLTVFAAETIKVLNPVNQTGVTYNFLKIFDAYVDNGEIVYYTTHANWANKLNEDVETTNLILTYKDATTGTNALPERWEVTKTALYRASQFSTYLAGLDLFDETNHTLTTTATGFGFATVEGVFNQPVEDVMDGIPVPGAGYYYIEYSNGAPYALTTVLENATSAIENKNDMPFDKHVYKEAAMTNDIDYKSVQVGDTVYYKVTAKVPNMGDNTTYMMKIWDILGDGLELNSTDGAATPQLDLLSIKIGTNEMKGDEVVRAGNDLVNPVENIPANAYWVNVDTTDPEYTETMPAFVVNFDLIDLGVSTGDDIVITYSAKVTKSIGVVRNTAHLVAEDYNKDAQTQNYVSQIVVDKFETGNAEQKLAGADFILFKVIVDTPAVGNPGDAGYVAAVTHKEYYKSTKDADGNVTAVEWVTDENQASHEVTIEDGSAKFAGLTDGTYYLEEKVAPTGYVRVETPIEVIVNGSASLDPTNTVDNNPTQTTANQNYYLSNVAQVANTPGSVLPSTGGRGTTMLYMAGLGMMLAAGAFLIFRRRAEAGK